MTKSTLQLFLVTALVSLFFGPNPVNGQPLELKYQARGTGFSEGVISTPSTGMSLVLIGALIDYQEPPSQTFPTNFRARFYLPDAQPPYLTIREIKSRYNYWLSDLKQNWKPQTTVEFVWPTDKVVRKLREEGELGLTDLGATVRLGSSGLGNMEETVTPVALYHSQAPRTVEGYRFVFLPNQEMSLQFEVLPDKEGQVLEPSGRFDVLPDTAQTFRWKAGNRPEGWYRLKVTGRAANRSSGNPRISRIVRFYHTPQMR